MSEIMVAVTWLKVMICVLYFFKLLIHLIKQMAAGWVAPTQGLH
jgi:hypothetical protein